MCCVGAPLNILLFIYEDEYIIIPETEGKAVMLPFSLSFLFSSTYLVCLKRNKFKWNAFKCL